jgi:hypothetical protein
MAEYRVYIVDAEGYSTTLPQVIQSDDDQAAVQQARQFVDGIAVQVWHEGIHVATLKPDK